MAKIKFFQGPASSVTLEAPFTPAYSQGNFIIATDTYTVGADSKSTIRLFYDEGPNGSKQRTEIIGLDYIKHALMTDTTFTEHITTLINTTTNIADIRNRLTAIEASYVKAIAEGNAITITDTAGTKTIGVKVSSTTGNILTTEDDGLYVPTPEPAKGVIGTPAIAVDSTGANHVVSLTINANDKVLSQDTNGLLSTLSLAKVTPGSSDYASQYKLVGKDGTTALGATIDIPKDQFLKNAEFIESATQADKNIDPAVVIGDPYLKLTFQTASGESVIYVALKPLLNIYEGGDGVNIVYNSADHNNTVSVVVDPASETFLTVGTNGVKLSGVQTAINTAANAAQAAAEATADDLMDAHKGVGGTDQHPLATGTVAGFSEANFSPDEKTKLNDIAPGAQVNVLEGVQTNGVDLTITNKKVNIVNATTLAAGLMSSDDKTKLNGIATGAQVNVIEKVKVGTTDLTVDSEKRVTIPTATDSQTGTVIVKNALGSSTTDTISQNEAKKIDDQFVIVTFS